MVVCAIILSASSIEIVALSSLVASIPDRRLKVAWAYVDDSTVVQDAKLTNKSKIDFMFFSIFFSIN